MSKKFHITKKGTPDACTATDKPCPLGGEHFDTMEEATAAAESLNEAEMVDEFQKASDNPNLQQYFDPELKEESRKKAEDIIRDYSWSANDIQQAKALKSEAVWMVRNALREHLTAEGMPYKEVEDASARIANKAGQPFTSVDLYSSGESEEMKESLKRFDVFYTDKVKEIAKRQKAVEEAIEKRKNMQIDVLVAQREIERIKRLDVGDQYEAAMLNKMTEKGIPTLGSRIVSHEQVPEFSDLRVEKDGYIRNLYLEDENGKLVRVLQANADGRFFIDENGNTHDYALVETGWDTYKSPQRNYVVTFDTGGEQADPLALKAQQAVRKTEDGKLEPIVGVVDRPHHWVNGKKIRF